MTCSDSMPKRDEIYLTIDSIVGYTNNHRFADFLYERLYDIDSLVDSSSPLQTLFTRKTS